MSQALVTQLVRELALEIKPEGEFFTLKSGEKSSYYLDCRNLHLTPKGLHAVVMALHGKLMGMEFDAIGGPSLGADPIIGGLMFVAGMMPRAKYRGFLVRSAGKEHGKSGRIVGPLKQGDRCVVVEDVTTTGGSALDACDEVEAFGAKVVHVFSVVDRLRGGAEAFAARGIPFESILTIKDLGL